MDRPALRALKPGDRALLQLVSDARAVVRVTILRDAAADRFAPIAVRFNDERSVLCIVDGSGEERRAPRSWLQPFTLHTAQPVRNGARA